MYYTSRASRYVARVARGGVTKSQVILIGGVAKSRVFAMGGSLYRGPSLDPKSGTPPPPVNNDHPLNPFQFMAKWDFSFFGAYTWRNLYFDDRYIQNRYIKVYIF